MERDSRAYLWDIRQAADRIGQFVADKHFEDYAEQDMLRSAVERQFEIIGEALNQLTRQDSRIAKGIPDSGRIISFRNLLIHGYAVIDNRMVWRVVQESLPELKSAVIKLLDVAEKNQE